MKILTCNVRVCVEKDGENYWEKRKAFCADVINSQKADVICFQEMQNQHSYQLHTDL